MISIFSKYYYNEDAMKQIKKIAALSTIFLLSLVSCASEIKSYCLETSDTFESYEGKCYQASRSNVVDTVFLINTPNNPEAEDGQYKYDLVWNKVVNTDHFTFTGGLEGKTIIEAFRVDDYIIKINFDGKSVNDEVDGYIKVSPLAFASKSKETKGAHLYAYIKVGEFSGLVDKPTKE